LTNIAVNTSSDGVGSYQEIDFNYVDSNSSSRGGGIRAYNSKPIVLFVDSYLSKAPNTTPFPGLSTYPANLYHMDFQYAFAHQTFKAFVADSPWLYFDALGNSFMLSPASNFMIASTTKIGSKTIVSGINSTITTLPVGFVHKTFLVIGQGINNVFQI
jgi:hypothetical protein